MSALRRVGFAEVRDNLLTSFTGGVAAESHPFPPPGARSPPYRYSLLTPPVADITSVYGTRNGESRLFRPGVDFNLLGDAQTLEWPEGAETPDPGTTFNVNYRPRAAGSVVTDIYTGSVARTVAESIALEMARLYAQAEAVYQSGFIDTATGRSLENLVALLDLERVPGGRAAGEVVLERAAGSRGSITIPAGTRIMTADGAIEYATTNAVTLSETQSTVRVAARDVEPNEPVAAGALQVLPVPIAGIGKVNNPAPTAIATSDETDEQLRVRAKSFLHGSERGTIGAISQALKRQGVGADVVEVFAEPLGGDPAACAIDRVEVTPHVEDMTEELRQRLLSAIDRVRPAGVVVRLLGAVAPKAVDIEMRLKTGADLTGADRRAIQRNIVTQLTGYLAALPAVDAASTNRIVGLVLGNTGVEDVTLLAATLHDIDATGVETLVPVLDQANGRLAVGAAAPGEPGYPKKLGELRAVDPGLPTRLDVTVVVPAGEVEPSESALRAALTSLVTGFNATNVASAGGGPTPPPPGPLTFATLAAGTPLPGVAAGSADPTPYTLQFALTAETGISRVLRQTGDAYQAIALEQLALSIVEIRVES